MTQIKHRIAALEAQRARTLSDVATWVVYDADGRHEFSTLADARAACPEAFDMQRSIEVVTNGEA